MTENFEVRKTQALSSGSLAVVIPIEYAKELGIERGDYIKIRCNNSSKKITLERIELP